MRTGADTPRERGSSPRPRLLAVGVATVVGAVLLAMASCGADGPDGPAAGAPTSDELAGSVSPATTEVATVDTRSIDTAASATATTDPSTTSTSAPPTTAPATTAPATTAPATTVPATDRPREVDSVLVVGDSMARSLFPPMQAALETDTTEVRLRWVIGTVVGDEMAKWEQIFTEQRPDVVVVHFMPWESATLQLGAPVDLTAPDGMDRYVEEWVRPWIEMATASGGTIVWVGPPLAADPARSAEHQAVGEIWRDTIAAWNAAGEDDRRVVVVDTVELSAGPDGTFADVDATVDPPERMMNLDGVHWCQAGAARLADRLIGELQQLGIDTASDETPDWRTSAWANDPESVRASEPAFGDGFAYPPGECPTPDAS